MASKSAARDTATKSPIARIRFAPDLAAAQQAVIQRITDARYEVAVRLTGGEEWLLPIFERLEAEIEKLTAQTDTLSRARQIAKQNAAPKRAA
jgi:hypothetical protein